MPVLGARAKALVLRERQGMSPGESDGGEAQQLPEAEREARALRGSIAA
jgi:hypothetical protein